MLQSYLDDETMRNIFIGQFYVGYTGNFYISLYNSGDMQIGSTMNVSFIANNDNNRVYIKSSVNNYTATWNNIIGGIRKVIFYDSPTPGEPRSGTIVTVDMNEDIVLDDDRFLINFLQDSIIFKGDFV